MSFFEAVTRALHKTESNLAIASQLCAVFSTSSKVDEYTRTQKDALGSSSIWFIVVGATGLASPELYVKLCACHIIVCGLLSMLFWWKPVANGLRHVLDKYVALLFFMHFSVVNIASGFKFLPLADFASALISIIVLFLTSDTLLYWKDFTAACWAHLLYRHACYTGLARIFMPDVKMFVLQAASTVHWVHVLCLMHVSPATDATFY